MANHRRQKSSISALTQLSAYKLSSVLLVSAFKGAVKKLRRGFISVRIFFLLSGYLAASKMVTQLLSRQHDPFEIFQSRYEKTVANIRRLFAQSKFGSFSSVRRTKLHCRNK